MTLRVHEAPAAKEAPQPVSANSALVVDTVIGIVAVVLFLTVKLLAVLVVPCITDPNELDEGAIVIGLTPVPVSVALRGLSVPAEETVMLPLADPAVVGSKVALMVHEEPAANDAPQVLVSAKGAVAEILRACATASLFLTVNTAAALAVPSPTEPKLWDAGVIVTGALVAARVAAPL